MLSGYDWPLMVGIFLLLISVVLRFVGKRVDKPGSFDDDFADPDEPVDPAAADPVDPDRNRTI